MQAGAVWVSHALCAHAGVALSVCHAYAWRSAATTGLAIQWDMRSEAQDIAALSVSASAETKRIRPIILAGNMFLLSPTTMRSDVWQGWQYHDAPGKRGAALLFRRENATEPSFSPQMHGVKPDDQRWSVAVSGADGYSRAPARDMSGAELAALTVTIATAPGSALIEYWAAKGASDRFVHSTQ